MSTSEQDIVARLKSKTKDLGKVVIPTGARYESGKIITPTKKKTTTYTYKSGGRTYKSKRIETTITPEYKAPVIKDEGIKPTTQQEFLTSVFKKQGYDVTASDKALTLTKGIGKTTITERGEIIKTPVSATVYPEFVSNIPKQLTRPSAPRDPLAEATVKIKTTTQPTQQTKLSGAVITKDPQWLQEYESLGIVAPGTYAKEKRFVGASDLLAEYGTKRFLPSVEKVSVNLDKLYSTRFKYTAFPEVEKGFIIGLYKHFTETPSKAISLAVMSGSISQLVGPMISSTGLIAPAKASVLSKATYATIAGGRIALTPPGNRSEKAGQITGEAISIFGGAYVFGGSLSKDINKMIQVRSTADGRDILVQLYGEQPKAFAGKFNIFGTTRVVGVSKSALTQLYGRTPQVPALYQEGALSYALFSSAYPIFGVSVGGLTKGTPAVLDLEKDIIFPKEKSIQSRIDDLLKAEARHEKPMVLDLEAGMLKPLTKPKISKAGILDLDAPGPLRKTKGTGLLFQPTIGKIDLNKILRLEPPKFITKTKIVPSITRAKLLPSMYYKQLAVSSGAVPMARPQAGALGRPRQAQLMAPAVVFPLAMPRSDITHLISSPSRGLKRKTTLDLIGTTKPISRSRLDLFGISVTKPDPKTVSKIFAISRTKYASTSKSLLISAGAYDLRSMSRQMIGSDFFKKQKHGLPGLPKREKRFFTGRKRRRYSVKRKTKYQPSLVAVEKKVYGRKPKILTGLDIRPMLSGRTRRRKRRR